MIRYPMSPEVAKIIAEQSEKRRKARLLARELERQLREQEGEPEYPSWRYPFGWRAHAIATLLIAVVILAGYLTTLL